MVPNSAPPKEWFQILSLKKTSKKAKFAFLGRFYVRTGRFDYFPTICYERIKKIYDTLPLRDVRTGFTLLMWFRRLVILSEKIFEVVADMVVDMVVDMELEMSRNRWKQTKINIWRFAYGDVLRPAIDLFLWKIICFSSFLSYRVGKIPINRINWPGGLPILPNRLIREAIIWKK